MASMIHPRKRSDELKRCWADSNDEKPWKQARDKWKDHLGPNLGRYLFGALHALIAELLGVNPERFSNACAESKTLGKQSDKSSNILQTRTFRQIAKRLDTIYASPDLGVDQRHLLGQRRMARGQLPGDTLQCRVQA